MQNILYFSPLLKGEILKITFFIFILKNLLKTFKDSDYFRRVVINFRKREKVCFNQFFISVFNVKLLISKSEKEINIRIFEKTLVISTQPTFL